MYQQKHVHNYEQSVKGETKIETKGQIKVETKGGTKGQVVVETKGGSKGGQIKGQISQKKGYYSPAEYYKFNGQQQQKQEQHREVVQQQQTEVQQQQQSEVLQQQQQQVRHVYNRPEPITPNQYRHIYQPNYAPSGRYSRCYCI